MAKRKSVLAIGAHTDECEFCVGGLTLILAEKGFRVVFLNTVGNNGLWSTVGPKKQKRDVQDAYSAAKVLGAEKILLPYQHHEFTAADFNAQRIDISDRMDKIVESFSQFTAIGEVIIKGLEKEKRALSLYRASESQWNNVKYAEAYKFLKYRCPGNPSVLPELLGNRFYMTRWPKATHEYCR